MTLRLDRVDFGREVVNEVASGNQAKLFGSTSRYARAGVGGAWASGRGLGQDHSTGVMARR